MTNPFLYANIFVEKLQEGGAKIMNEGNDKNISGTLKEGIIKDLTPQKLLTMLDRYSMLDAWLRKRKTTTLQLMLSE